MFNIWDDDGLGQKVRAPQRFGIGTAYVGSDAAFPTDAERQRATNISIKKGVVPAGTRWQTCASVDAVTGECAGFTIGQDAQPLPYWVTTGGPPPPGIIPTGVPVKGVQPKVSQPVPPTPPPPSTPKLPPMVDTTTRPSSGVIVPGPTQTSPGGKQIRRRYRERVVELCPLAGYVTRPVPGTSEYQVYRCTPGQRVTIDRGLQEAGIREAMQRQDVTRAGETGAFAALTETSSPNWLLIGGIAVGAWLLLGRGRR